MRGAIAALCLVGCGRIAFDPVADATGATGDGDAAELACTPFIRSLPMYGRQYPGVAWTGTQYLVETEDGTTSEFPLIPISPDGTFGPVISSVPSGETVIGTDSVVWTGHELLILSTSSNLATLRRYDPITHTVGPAQTLGSPASGAVMTWAGDRLAVAWQSGTTITLREFAPDGTPLSAENVVSTTNSGLDSIAASAGRFVVGKTIFGNGEISTVDRATGQSQTIGLDAGHSSVLRVVGHGDGTFGAAFVESNVSKLQPLDIDGISVGLGLPLPVPSTFTYVTFAATAAGYRLTSLDLDTATHANVTRYELDLAGNVIAGPTVIDSFSFVSLVAPSEIVASNRSLLLVTIDPGTGRELRAIQTCP